MFFLAIPKLTADTCDHCYQCMRLAKAQFEVNHSLSVELDQFGKMGWRTECPGKIYTLDPKCPLDWRLRRMAGSDKLSAWGDAR